MSNDSLQMCPRTVVSAQRHASRFVEPSPNIAHMWKERFFNQLTSREGGGIFPITRLEFDLATRQNEVTIRLFV